MRKYVSHMFIIMRNQQQYKLNLLFSTFGILIMIICLRELWSSLYANNQVSRAMSLEKMLLYSTASFIISSFMIRPFAGAVSERIKSGLIVIDLLRPWSFFGFMLSRTFGEMIGNLLTKSLILLIFVLAIYGVNTNIPLNYFPFLISLSLSFFVAFGIYYLIALLSFKLTEVWGIDLLFSTLFLNVFSGAVIPLWIYPNGLRNIIYYLPFRAIYDIPLSILVGQIAGKEIFVNIAFQVIWAIFLFISGIGIFRRVINKLIISGG